jgi:hypothetical protein
MPNKTNNIHENEAMHMIPFVELEYERYRASRQKNRIVCALAVTNIAWFGLLLAYIFIR